MKPTKPSTKSSKILISTPTGNRSIAPNLDVSETIIPIGSDDIFVELSNLSNTYTYNIINSDQMTGNIELKTRNASLKGLVLNTMNNGNPQITPIEEGTVSFTMDSSVSDGCYVQTLSNGDFWYVWSIATGGNIGLRRGGGAIVVPTQQVVYNPPVFDSDPANAIVSTTTFPTVDALHTITQFNGTGPVGATLTLTETAFDTVLDTVNGLDSITVTVDVNGDWQYTPTQPIELSNGDYSFLINDPSVPSGGSTSERFFRDTGPITFTVPQSPILVEQGTIFNFISDTVAAAFDANGTPITVAVDTAATDGTETHGDTLSITYSINPSGTQIDRGPIEVQIYKQPPAAPVIDAASFTGLTLNSSGTAEAGSIIKVYFDGVEISPTQPHPIVADNTGAWSFSYDAGTSTTIGTLKVHAVDTHGQISGPSNTFASLSTQNPPPAPTLSVDGVVNGGWTNVDNGYDEFTVEGTTADPAATVTLFAGGTEITANTYPELKSGPTYDGAGGWSATIEALDESQATLTAKATLNGQTGSDSSPFDLRVDRLTPAITLNGSDQTVGLPNVGTGNDLGIASVSNVYSGIATQTSNWDSVVANQTTEQTVQVSYNVTDNAGNTAVTVYRNVTITTEVIVPTITSIVDNQDGTLRVQGTVVGTYSGNLTVQVKVGGSNDGSPVSVNNETFDYTTTNLGNGTFAITAVTINTAGEVSGESNEENTTISMQAPADTTPPVITITDDATLADITNTTVSITEGDTFTFTVTATDLEDGDITGNIVTGGDTLDTTTAGTYNLTFDVSDSASPNPNTDSATLTVEVSAASGLFFEELSSAFSNLANGAVISNGIFEKESANGTTEIAMDSNGIMQFSGVNPVNTDFTLSFWFKPDANFGTGYNYVMGKYASGSEPNSEFRIAMAKHSSGFIQFRPYIGGMGQNTPTAIGFNSFVIGNWYHVAMTYKYNSSSSKYEFRTYLDGVPGGNKLDLTYSILDTFKSSRIFGIGRTKNGAGNSFIGGSPDCSLDSIQFGDGIVLDDYQIQQIYNQSNRLMSIATAQALTDPSPGSNSPTTFIEDNDDVISRNPGKINTSTGEYRDLGHAGGTSGLQVLLDTDGVIEYNAGQPLNDEFTISWWMKPDATQPKRVVGVLGYDISNNRKLTLKINNADTGLSNPDFVITIGTPNNANQEVKYVAGTNPDISNENWHHFAIRCQSNGSGGLITQLFVDGSVLGSQQGFANLGNRVPTGFKILPPSSNESFYFGSAPDVGSSGNNGSIKGQFDSMQMGVVLSDSQIAAIAAQSDRQMSIATASGL